MTKEQLFQKHLEAIVLRKDHVPITVEYTIDILENMRLEYDDEQTYPIMFAFIGKKIEELKKSL